MHSYLLKKSPGRGENASAVPGAGLHPALEEQLEAERHLTISIGKASGVPEHGERAILSVFDPSICFFSSVPARFSLPGLRKQKKTVNTEDKAGSFLTSVGSRRVHFSAWVSQNWSLRTDY